MFSLRCDYRENRGGCVIDCLRRLQSNGTVTPAHTYELRDEVLTTGDYVLQAGPHVLFIERKTWADLAASIKDGRIFCNHKKMLDAATSGFRICYLIEGRAPSPDVATVKVDGIAIGSMMAKLDHFAFRDHVILEFTRDSAHTAARLLELGKHMLTLSGAEVKSADLAAVDAIAKKKHVHTVADTQREMLTCVAGIGEKTGAALLAAFPFGRVVHASHLLPEGAASKAVMDELRELAAGRREAVLAAMLVKITGVSATTAAHVVTAFRELQAQPKADDAPAWPALPRGQQDIKMIENIKIGGRRVGPAIATRICDHFEMSVMKPPVESPPVAEPPTNTKVEESPA